MKKIINIRPHAKRQLKERDISISLVKRILLNPGQVMISYSDRKIAQSLITYKGESFLLRVVYKDMDKELRIITVYMTKKIKKYWR